MLDAMPGLGSNVRAIIGRRNPVDDGKDLIHGLISNGMHRHLHT